MEVIAGAATTCGLPPIAGCATLLAIATNTISKKVS
jgi:hypothetical protein